MGSQRPFGTDDRTETPGALMSGLSLKEMGVGPAALKPASVLSALETAATVIACAAVPGEADRAAPELVEVVPGGHDRDDAGGGGGVECERDEVA